MKHLAQFALLFVLLLVPGCPRPGTPGSPGLLDCSSQAVRDHAIPLVPKVNSCLIRALAGDVAGCLISLISPAAGITEEIVGCLVRSQGASFAAAAQVNSTDTVSAAGAENARAFLKAKGYAFKN